MTRPPAPADDADLDLALREAAEQWRLDFEVPPMPLLDNESQPLEVRAPARLRWTRPVLVAASIVAVGAIVAGVLSASRPDTNTDTRISSSTPSATASSEVQQLTKWPAPEGQHLVIEVGSPPSSITLGAATMERTSSGSEPWLVVDSDRPNFVRILGTPDLGGGCGSATRLYLSRTASGAITVTSAYYRPALNGQPCPAVGRLSWPLQGEAPFAVAGQQLIEGSTGAAMLIVDLADYPAPQYVPAGFTLGATAYVTPVEGSHGAFRVSRNLAPPGRTNGAGITLTWQGPSSENLMPAVRPSWSKVSVCASRQLAGGISVTACDVSADPQQAISEAELQRVVDSIPG